MSDCIIQDNNCFIISDGVNTLTSQDKFTPVLALFALKYLKRLGIIPTKEDASIAKLDLTESEQNRIELRQTWFEDDTLTQTEQNALDSFLYSQSYQSGDITQREIVMFKRIKQLMTIKAVFGFLTGYAAILSFVTFPLFIMEESVQVAQGGAWAAKAAKDWEGMRMGCELVDTIASDLKTINLYFGWIHPFAYRAYNHYAVGSHYYAKACFKQADAKEHKD